MLFAVIFFLFQKFKITSQSLNLIDCPLLTVDFLYISLVSKAGWKWCSRGQVSLVQ
jgi:hypothetical protein